MRVVLTALKVNRIREEWLSSLVVGVTNPIKKIRLVMENSREEFVVLVFLEALVFLEDILRRISQVRKLKLVKDHW
jgi:hypothetical protein